MRPTDCSPPSSRQEYWSGLPFPSPGYLPDPGIEPRSPTLQADALTSAPPGEPLNKRIKGGKEARLKEEGVGGGRGGAKGWPYRRLLPPTDAQAYGYGAFLWASREGRTETRPYQTRTRIRVLCQEEVISLQSSAQAEGPSTRFLHPGPGD